MVRAERKGEERLVKAQSKEGRQVGRKEGGFSFVFCFVVFLFHLP